MLTQNGVNRNRHRFNENLSRVTDVVAGRSVKDALAAVFHISTWGKHLGPQRTIQRASIECQIEKTRNGTGGARIRQT